MLIDITKMNNGPNHYQYSNMAEAAIINAITPYATNQYTHINTNGISHGDVWRNQMDLGDIKCQSSMDFCIELQQTKQNKLVNGWYLEYYLNQTTNMKFIMFVNLANSARYGTRWKIRIVEFQNLIAFVQANITNANIVSINGSSLFFINPNALTHNWIGDFGNPQMNIIDTNDFKTYGGAVF